MSEYVAWGDTHCPRCGRPLAGEDEYEEYEEANNDDDSERVEELENEYCWSEQGGDCTKVYDEYEVLLDLRQKIDDLKRMAGKTAIFEFRHTKPIAWRKILVYEPESEFWRAQTYWPDQEYPADAFWCYQPAPPV